MQYKAGLNRSVNFVGHRRRVNIGGKVHSQIQRRAVVNSDTLRGGVSRSLWIIQEDKRSARVLSHYLNNMQSKMNVELISGNWFLLALLT